MRKHLYIAVSLSALAIASASLSGAEAASCYTNSIGNRICDGANGGAAGGTQGGTTGNGNGGTTGTGGTTGSGNGGTTGSGTPTGNGKPVIPVYTPPPAIPTEFQGMNNNLTQFQQGYNNLNPGQQDALFKLFDDGTVTTAQVDSAKGPLYTVAGGVTYFMGHALISPGTPAPPPLCTFTSNQTPPAAMGTGTTYYAANDTDLKNDLALAKDGDNIMLLAGATFTQPLNVTWSGTDTNPVTIGAYHVDTTTGQPVVGLGGLASPIVQAGQSIAPIDVSAGGLGGIVPVTQAQATAPAITIQNANNVVIQDITLQQVNNDPAIMVNGATNLFLNNVSTGAQTSYSGTSVASGSGCVL